MHRFPQTRHGRGQREGTISQGGLRFVTSVVRMTEVLRGKGPLTRGACGEMALKSGVLSKDMSILSNKFLSKLRSVNKNKC